MTGMREWRVAPSSRVAASLNVSPEQWPHSGRGSGTTGGLAHRMEPRSGGSADTSHLVKQIAFVEIHAETFQNMNKLILEANLLMVFGLIPDITLDSFYMRMRIGKRAVTALPFEFIGNKVVVVDEPRHVGFQFSNHIGDSRIYVVCEKDMHVVVRAADGERNVAGIVQKSGYIRVHTRPDCGRKQRFAVLYSENDMQINL